MEKKLEVKNLRISFRTVSGKVQAVRGISFDLMKGETLAIVGESGSGKSVTSKAIIGILAGNSIVEGGEILYDGKDLLKISEDDFYRIRGDKIAMIFQDPLSSLNPIMRIGKQLTEAMILKGKARQKASRVAFNSYLERLRTEMVAELSAGDKAKADGITLKCKNFDLFEFKHLELEQAYDAAVEAANETIEEIDDILFLIDKKSFKDAHRRLHEVCEFALKSINTWVVSGDDAANISSCVSDIKADKTAVKTGEYAKISESMKKISEICKSGLSKTQPNFFSMGYYLTFSGKPLPEYKSVEELNTYLHSYLDDNFMLGFIKEAQCAIEASARRSKDKKAESLKVLADAFSFFECEAPDKVRAAEIRESAVNAVESAIDKLEITKDSIAYTFRTSFDTALALYFDGIVKNKKETDRFEKQTAKYNALVSRGKTPEWSVVPLSLADLEAALAGVRTIISRMSAHYSEQIAAFDKRDFHAQTVAGIDYLKASASGVVYKVTKHMAKSKAIKLMEEVGISEPRKRFRQYPFEFSGGMRQRIVIAIALAADPDILICDEPTTALDVTIQAQILELINKLKRERNLSIIFITHNLGVVANMADRIAVMYAGKIVEYGTAEDVFYAPAHPYTWALLSSMPDLETKEKLEAIPGTVPDMIYPPVGDAFAARNKYALKIDFEEEPPMFKVSDTHYAATWLLHPKAPKVEPPKIVTDRIERMKNAGGESDVR